jgi:hypothetical protein
MCGRMHRLLAPVGHLSECKNLKERERGYSICLICLQIYFCFMPLCNNAFSLWSKEFTTLVTLLHVSPQQESMTPSLCLATHH